MNNEKSKINALPTRSKSQVISMIDLGKFIRGSKTAVAIKRVLAALGVAGAAAQLGDYHYEKTIKTFDIDPHDLIMARKWYRKSAELGDHQLHTQHTRLEGIKAKEPWRVTEVIELLCFAAERGHERAQWELMYHDYFYPGYPGSARPDFRDYKMAFYWCCRVAELGDPSVQNHLGAMYVMGRGIHQNDKMAVKWYRKAAEAEMPEAQFNLGHMYEFGLGIEQNFVEAAFWYSKATNWYLPSALSALGDMYSKGRGVEKDFVQAYRWAGLAVANGNKAARRDQFGRELTPKQIVAAKRWIAENDS